MSSLSCVSLLVVRLQTLLLNFGGVELDKDNNKNLLAKFKRKTCLQNYKTKNFGNMNLWRKLSKFAKTFK